MTTIIDPRAGDAVYPGEWMDLGDNVSIAVQPAGQVAIRWAGPQYPEPRCVWLTPAALRQMLEEQRRHYQTTAMTSDFAAAYGLADEFDLGDDIFVNVGKHELAFRFGIGASPVITLERRAFRLLLIEARDMRRADRTPTPTRPR